MSVGLVNQMLNSKQIPVPAVCIKNFNCNNFEKQFENFKHKLSFHRQKKWSIVDLIMDLILLSDLIVFPNNMHVANGLLVSYSRVVLRFIAAFCDVHKLHFSFLVKIFFQKIYLYHTYRTFSIIKDLQQKYTALLQKAQYKQGSTYSWKSPTQNL